MKKWLKIALYSLCSMLVLTSLVIYKNTSAKADHRQKQPKNVVVHPTVDPPNAHRDLILKDVSWQKGGIGSVGIHSFSIYNASKRYDYPTVTVRFSYYSDLGDEVGHIDKQIDKAMKIGETVRIDKLETGVLSQHADGADMEIL